MIYVLDAGPMIATLANEQGTDVTIFISVAEPMDCNINKLPLDNLERTKAQLRKSHLAKAVKTCRNNNIALECLQPMLNDCVERLYKSKAFGTILSAYYVAGEFAVYSTEELLRKTYEQGDYSSFLKQAYRFDAYRTFPDQIKTSIDWHHQKNLPDAVAWAMKFAKLREHVELSKNSEEGYEILAESVVKEHETEPKAFLLKPLFSTKRSKKHIVEDDIDDPYIVSQKARVKQEQANNAHKLTLEILRSFLSEKAVPVLENKLIDAFATLNGVPAIFEVKSITIENEREQIRHAVSQLYEYRFLHSMPDASLWIVFSNKLSSQWYVEYLSHDRGIKLLWVENGSLLVFN